MYAIGRKPSLQLAPETVFKSTFKMVKYHRDRVPLASAGTGDCRSAVEMLRKQLGILKCIS